MISKWSNDICDAKIFLQNLEDKKKKAGMKANWSSSAENSVREKIHYKWNWLFSLVGNLIHWLFDWLFAAVLACKEWSVRGICNHWWQSCLSVSRCMCPAENPGCRDQPFTILYRVMDVLSGRSVPSDIFQMQATTRYPGAYYIFQIKSGNEGREFYMRVSLALAGKIKNWSIFLVAAFLPDSTTLLLLRAI